MQSVLAGHHFETTSLLKSGSGVSTYLGVDVELGQKVVIKRAPSSAVSGSAQLRLEHEAEVLREVSAPGVGISPPIGCGRDSKGFFLVAPYVAGETLAERIARGPLTVDETLAVAIGLMRALREAHEHRVVHRDVKPANIVLGEHGEVTLIDFGLARTAQLDGTTRDEPVGTIAYVSPEQAGLLDFEVGERSDLYSAGVVLFECLAGRPPFTGATVGEVLRQHLTRRAPELRSRNPDVPRALDAVIQRLLRKDPRDRYQSAEAVVSDLEAIARARKAGDVDPALVIGVRDRRHTLTEPAFVGRDAELSALDAEIDRVRAGDARLVLLEAESGTGKSRLLDEVAIRAAQKGAWVFRGQATMWSAPRPLEAFLRVLRALASAAAEDPSIARSLRARLGDHVEAVCSVLPALGEVLMPGHPIPAGPEAYGKARVLPALTALLDALGSAERPAVVLLDDVHSADELSLEILDAWWRTHGSSDSRAHVLITAAYRSDEVDVGHPLRKLTPSLRLVLPPLSENELRRLASSMAGELPEAALSLVVRISEGNPFIAATAIEGLVEGGALVRVADAWTIEPRAMATAQSSGRGASYLARRLELLPEPVLSLLSNGAILGKTFDLSLAAQLAGRPVSAAMQELHEARHRHLVWSEPNGARFTFAHDRIRARMLERLTDEERKRLHRLAARLLESADRASAPSREELAFDLAYHFDEAGDAASALPWALEAARSARARYAFEIAAQEYRIALRGLDAGATATMSRGEVAEALGDVLLLRGEYDEATRQLTVGRALATSPMDVARIEGKLGEIAFKQGRTAEAGEAIVRALATLGRSTPGSSFAFALAMLHQALVQALRTLFPRWFVGRGRPERRDIDLLAAHLYSRLAYTYWFHRGQIATFWAHLSEMNLAERHPPSRELAQAYSEHAIGMTGLPRVFFRRGRVYGERGIEIRRALGDQVGEGISLSLFASVLYAEGRYREALEKFTAASRALTRIGDRWEANIAGFQAAFCQYRLGALRDAVDACRRIYADSSEIGDRHAKGIVLEIWAKATGGAVPAELIEAALSSTHTDAQTEEAVLQASAVRFIHDGDPLRAADQFAEAQRVVRRAGLESEFVSYISLWRGYALRLAAEHPLGEVMVLREHRLTAAERENRRAVRIARRYRGNLPMALRERALLLARRSALKRALRAIEESVSVAESLGLRVELAHSLLVRGEIRSYLRDSAGAEEATRARARLHELGAGFVLRRTSQPGEAMPTTLSLADRFASIVDSGRRIAAALTNDEVNRATCAAAAMLLRGDTASVIVFDRGELRAVARVGGRDRLMYSRTLVERARDELRPVLMSETAARTSSDSILLSAVRSALCAPIVACGQVVAYLHVTHHLVDSLFGEEELRLAGYIVALAGASLEKADAFAQIHALSLSLEQRVKERTAELRAANEQLDANLRQLQRAQGHLLQAGKMAAMGTLVAGLSHEINNPVSVIVAQTQRLLRSVPQEDPAREPLEAIGRQASRCVALIRSMLDFSRQSSGRRELTRPELLVSEVADLARSKAKNLDVTLLLEVRPELPSVSANRTEMESAILNIVNNAIDASARGDVVRIAALEAGRDGRDGVEIRIEDQGHGIPEELLPMIFDPFFTTKPVGQGTGLGLSLAHQIVEAHGGHIDVESGPEGTSMRLWLPVGGD